MIVDSSALISVVKREVDADLFYEALRTLPGKIAAPTVVECGIVADASGPRETRRLDALVRLSALEIIPFDAEMARVARAAYREFGRGSRHAAKLNFGDCFSYALATITGEPLLYKGDDFAHTDVRSALD